MVYVLLAPGFEEAEALVPVDLLRRANVETATVSLTGEPVPGSHGITVTADLAMDQVDLDRAEMVVLPGGGPGYKNLGADPRVEQLVRRAVERDIWVAAICAAPTLLGKWGLLEGKQAVCYPGMEEGLVGAIPPKPGSSVVRDGKIITGRAAGAAFDFSAELITALLDRAAADNVLESICY
ncbi:MAG: DJ-1/PfpI family protein [Lawsonibacter sp.]|nr:DJ-1/PfpI family protein [Lawsonibacter sp.]